MQQVLSAVCYFIVNLRKRQDRQAESFPTLFVSQMTLLLHILSSVVTLADHMSVDIVQRHITETMELAQTEINSWISVSIGGKMFGKYIYSGYIGASYLFKQKDEFEVSSIAVIIMKFCMHLYIYRFGDMFFLYTLQII